jgi:hypothetical protein
MTDHRTLRERIIFAFDIDQPVRRFNGGRICNWCKATWHKEQEHPDNDCIALVGLRREALLAPPAPSLCTCADNRPHLNGCPVNKAAYERFIQAAREAPADATPATPHEGCGEHSYFELCCQACMDALAREEAQRQKPAAEPPAPPAPTPTPQTLECPCCGDEGAVADAEGCFTDGQPLTCGCPGMVSVDTESDPFINNGDEPCAKCARKADRS